MNYEEYKKQVQQNVTKYQVEASQATIDLVILRTTNNLLAELIGAVLKVGTMLDDFDKYYRGRENPEFIASQQKLVSVAGSAVLLPPVEIPFDHEVTITALTSNGGTIYVGNTQIESQDTTIGYPLLAGQSVSFKIKNLNQLWINATADNEGIRWTVETES